MTACSEEATVPIIIQTQKYIHNTHLPENMPCGENRKLMCVVLYVSGCTIKIEV